MIQWIRGWMAGIWKEFDCGWELVIIQRKSRDLDRNSVLKCAQVGYVRYQDEGFRCTQMIELSTLRPVINLSSLYSGIQWCPNPSLAKQKDSWTIKSTRKRSLLRTNQWWSSQKESGKQLLRLRRFLSYLVLSWTCRRSSIKLLFNLRHLRGTIHSFIHLSQETSWTSTGSFTKSGEAKTGYTNTALERLDSIGLVRAISRCLTGMGDQLRKINASNRCDHHDVAM